MRAPRKHTKCRDGGQSLSWLLVEFLMLQSSFGRDASLRRLSLSCSSAHLMPRSTVVAPGIACEGSTLPSEDTQHALVNQSLAGVIDYSYHVPQGHSGQLRTIHVLSARIAAVQVRPSAKFPVAESLVWSSHQDDTLCQLMQSSLETARRASTVGSICWDLYKTIRRDSRGKK